MNSSTSSSRAPKRNSRSTSNTRPSTNTLTSKSTGPYNRNFQQNLIDGGVLPPAYRYPDGRLPEKPINWGEIQRRLREPRPSLSSSKFSEEDHERFVQADADAFKEKQITTSVIPIIEGYIEDAKCVSGGIQFANLDHLTDGTLVPGNPDIYYGARPEQLHRRVRDELSGHIIPSTHDDLPIVPNFFLAAKGPDGSLAVASKQASYDGSLGARGMQSLLSYGQAEPVTNNNAYTITSIYHGGQLKMYTSHAIMSTSPDSQPEYHMHQLNTWGLTGNIETFRQGAGAYRNLRDWAKEQRDGAIKRANERAVELPANRLAVDPSLHRTPSCSNETTIEEGSRLSEESRNLLDETTNTTADLEESDASCELTLGALHTKRPSQHSKRLNQTQRKRRNAGISDYDLSQQLELQTSGPSELSQQFENQVLEQEQDSQLSQIDLQPIDPTETLTETDISAQTTE